MALPLHCAKSAVGGSIENSTSLRFRCLGLLGIGAEGWGLKVQGFRVEGFKILSPHKHKTAYPNATKRSYKP